MQGCKVCLLVAWLSVLAVVAPVSASFPTQWGGCPTPPAPVPAADWNASQHAAVKEALTQVTVAARRLLQSQKSAGISLGVVYDQELVFSTGFGAKDLSADKPTTPDADTIYRIGSISKIFAMLAMMKSRDAGLISLDDEVSKHVKEFTVGPVSPSSRSKRGITFRQLATHLAGMPREGPCTGLECPISDAEAWGRIARMEQILETDELPVYSNLGFSVLGNAVAHVNGLTYDQLLNTTIIHPLGLTNTGVEMGAADPALLARPYNEGPVPCSPSECLTDFGWSAPAGAMYSTVRDLGRIMSLMFRDRAPADGKGQILDGATIRETLLPTFMNRNNQDGFAMTWELYRLGDYTVRTKRGDVPGYASEVIMVPELKLGMVVLANIMEHAQTTAQTMAGLLIPAFDAALRTAARKPLLPPLPLPAYVGTYTTGVAGVPSTLVVGHDDSDPSHLTLAWDFLDDKVARLRFLFTLESAPSGSAVHVFEIGMFPGSQVSCIEQNMQYYYQKAKVTVAGEVVTGIRFDFVYGVEYKRTGAEAARLRGEGETGRARIL